MFAPSVRNKNGSAPAIVVHVVARRAGIFFLNPVYIDNIDEGFKERFKLSTQSTDALTVIPLTAIKAHAIAEL